MSGYGTYEWQSERERRRREIALLRGELAALRQRARTVTKLATQARNAGLAVPAPRTVGTPADEPAALTAAISRLRDDLAETERRLAESWQSRYDAIASGGTRTVSVRSAASAVSELRTPAPRPSTVDTAVRSYHATAEALVDEVTMRCGERDVAALRKRLAEIESTTDPDRAHALVADLRGRAQEAIERAIVARRREETRARLLTLVEEVGRPERDRLRRWVASVPDPGVPEVEQTVLTALEQDNHERARREVAETVASALTELGYAIGEEFTTTLAGAPADRTAAGAIVPLPAFPGHGLRMTFDASDRLFTTVVRGEDIDAADDAVAQDAVCRQLDEVADRAAASGVRLRMVRRVAPGARPAPVVDPALLGRTPARRSTRTTARRTQRANPGGRA